MNEHPIQGLMDTTLQHIREMVDANTIIGDQITTGDGTVIIPVSKVSVGFASGGSDLPNKIDKEYFGGGGGAGASISPIAFIVVNGGQVKLLQITPNSSSADNAISMIPELIDKITGLFSKEKKKEKEKNGAKTPPKATPCSCAAPAKDDADDVSPEDVSAAGTPEGEAGGPNPTPGQQPEATI